jgi:hypothetical protein
MACGMYGVELTAIGGCAGCGCKLGPFMTKEEHQAHLDRVWHKQERLKEIKVQMKEGKRVATVEQA